MVGTAINGSRRPIRALARAAMSTFVLLCAHAGPAVAAQTPQPIGHELLTVRADRVYYYADEALLQARGDVVVDAPDGAVISGDAFSMDVGLRRFVVAGHVRFRFGAVAYDGAAFAEFLAFRRGYFVPLEPMADRWTFLDGDYGHPEMGRAMPGDAFALPDLSGVRPYVVTRMATVDPTTFAKFAPATVAVLGGPMTPPLPGFVDNFSDDPDFGVNSLAGATFDAPYEFNGAAWSLETLHLRYDQTRPVKTFLSFEHHSVFDDGGYAVFSLNPATQYQKQWELLGYARAGASSAVSLNAQLFTAQRGLLEPSSANGFADVQLVRALRESSLRLDVTQGYENLLNAAVTPNHPLVAGLTWAGFEQPVGRSGFSLRLRSGIAADHDAFGVSGFGRGDEWSRFAGLIASTPSVAAPLRGSINAQYDIERTWSTFPNSVQTDALTVSDGMALSPRFFAVATAIVTAVRSAVPLATVVSPNISTGFAPAPLSPNGLPVLDVPTIDARAVSRAYLLTGTWQPSTSFQFGVTLEKNRYSPAQLPAPYRLNALLRTKLTRALYVDVGRSYFFNWQSQGWSPQFTLQVSAQ